MQSVSSAQRIPSAGFVEQAAPNASAPDAGATQSSWKVFPAGTARADHADAAAVADGIGARRRVPGGIEGERFAVSSVPQKLMGQTPPPMASAAQ